MKRNIILLLFSVAVVIGAAGCFEENKKEQTPETFVPVEPGVRIQRFCQLLCLNTADGALTPLEELQEKLGKDSADKLDKMASAAKQQMLDLTNKETLPEAVERFMLLNKSIPEKVVKAMSDTNFRNLSVFLVKIDANYYAIRTFEYIGQNYELDWLDLTRNPDYIEWNNVCEECQIPVGSSGEGGLIQWSLSGDEILYLPLIPQHIETTQTTNPEASLDTEPKDEPETAPETTGEEDKQ